MEELLGVAEDNEGGGSYRGLSHIVDLKSLTLVRGRLNSVGRIVKQIVEHTGGDTLSRLGIHLVDELVDVGASLSGERGNVDDRSVRHIGKRSTNLLGILVNGVVVLLNGIPLVDNDDNRLACLVSDACDLLILLGNAVLTVDQSQDVQWILHTFHQLIHQLMTYQNNLLNFL